MSARQGLSVLAGVLLVLILSAGCFPTNLMSTKVIEKSEEPARDDFEQAEVLYQNQQYEQAFRTYDNFIKNNPQDDRIQQAYVRQGQIYIAWAKYAEAQRLFDWFLKQYPDSPQEANVLTQLGISCYYQEDYRQTITIFKKLLNKYPLSGSYEIYFMIAQSFYKLKDYNNAVVRFQSVIVRYPQAQDLSELNYGLGSAAFYLGRHQLAWDTLKQVSDEALPPAERVNLKLMLAELARLRENYWLAWLKLKSAFDDLRQTDHLQTIKTVDEVRELIKDLITDKLIPDQLLAIKENYPKNFPGGEALLRLAQLAKEALDYGRAQTLLDEFFTDFPAHPDYKTAQELKQKIEQTLAVDKNKLGLIVPLSGRFSVYGDMVLKGVELAIEEINRERENKFSLIIKDSQENPAQAAKSFETLVIEDRVIGIIGPVLSNSARIAAEVANRLLTPMITPTASAKGIPELGPYVFRNCITSTQQAQAITKFAIENMCLDEFAVLYPNNPYGIEFKDIFCSYVDQLGGKILGVMAYTEEETDFRQQAEYLSNLEPEAIFIPDYADKVVLIAPQLAFYAKEQTKEDLPEDVVLDEGESKQEKNYQQTLLEDKLKKETASEWWMETGKVDALPPTILPQRISPLAAEAAETEASIHPLDTSRIILLGTNEWYAPQLVKEGGDFVEHAVFPTGFYYDSPTPAIVEFISRFKERFWQAPNLLAAQAYDAARMLILAIDKGATDRESLRQNLLNLKDIPAISGQTSFTPEGDTDKTLFMIGINHNRLRQLKGDEEWLCYNPDKLKRKKRLEIIHNQPEGGENNKTEDKE